MTGFVPRVIGSGGKLLENPAAPISLKIWNNENRFC
jgi:hypothetical protein